MIASENFTPNTEDQILDSIKLVATDPKHWTFESDCVAILYPIPFQPYFRKVLVKSAWFKGAESVLSINRDEVEI